MCVCGGGLGGLRSKSFTCKPIKQTIDQSIDLCELDTRGKKDIICNDRKTLASQAR